MHELIIKIPMWVWFGIASIFYTTAEYLSKSWGYKPSLFLAFSIISCYATGSACWLAIVLQKNEIARMSMVWQIVTTILSLFVGIILLSEKLNNTQYAGVVLGLVGLYLLTR